MTFIAYLHAWSEARITTAEPFARLHSATREVTIATACNRMLHAFTKFPGHQKARARCAEIYGKRKP